MMQSLVPPGVVAVEADTAGAGDDDGLLPAEVAALAPAAAPRRWREFAAGRTCARHALRALGVERVAILPGVHREPLWPAGIVGSITHCRGYSAAAVARREQVMSIGIDAEVNAPLPPGIAAMVCTGSERRWIRSAPDEPGISWPTLIFSAKESLFKTWFPLTARWLEFEDAELAIDPVGHSFVARLAVPLPDSLGRGPVAFAGRFALARERLLTVVVLPATATVPAATSLARG